MRLFNTLTRQLDEFKPLDTTVRMYSCGPTVYDRVHIGNLFSFIAVDTLRRALTLEGYEVKHVMNLTDIDDKMIKRSQELFPDDEPASALKQLADKYAQHFYEDIETLGYDTSRTTFLPATDHIESMQALVRALVNCGVGYVADDGVYFSLAKHRAQGRQYGLLSPVSEASTADERIANDEYDKEAVHDFALWKKQKDGEPAWPFTLGEQDLTGRPGWHLECSAMSTSALGQPYDIHTGGVDLIFPHHENEIAQSTACAGGDYARFFVHNEHVMVEGRKMSKSLGNIITLSEIADKEFEVLAVRLLALQSHYQSRSNFTWEALQAAQNRLHTVRALADQRFQPTAGAPAIDFEAIGSKLAAAVSDNLNTPKLLEELSQLETAADAGVSDVEAFTNVLQWLDDALGLQLLSGSDISQADKDAIAEREQARQASDYIKADQLRDQLADRGIYIKDTAQGPRWQRTPVS